MISCIFTIDYEIYGNGAGSVQELIYEPTENLRAVFRKWGAPFVPFVEVAELDVIGSHGADPAIELVEKQIYEMRLEGCEPALHLHPQWYNATRSNGMWILDQTEYNLCTLPKERIIEIVERAIAYLRRVLKAPAFIPVSFRAGNWLFQPTQTAAQVLAGYGVKIDSSVFKGGVRHEHALDYRRALSNGYFWRFSDHVDVPDPNGALLELPIYARMTPLWNLTTGKRIAFERRSVSGARFGKKYYRLRDVMRLKHPLKLDFCRMTLTELTGMVEAVIREDELDPRQFRPLVAIGHTKELNDLGTVDAFLAYLRSRSIPVETLKAVHSRCVQRV
jgi:hypothetical protein